MTWDHNRPDSDDSQERLPNELLALDQRLSRDGARWRGALPPAEPLARRVAALLEAAPVSARHDQPREGDTAFAADGTPRHDQRNDQRNDQKGRTLMHLGRMGHAKSWLAAAAALLVVGLMAALLVSLGLGRPGGHITRQATAAPSELAGRWETAAHLANASTIPIIAPSNAQVVYQVQPSSAMGVAHDMERSDDGGATWQALPVPQLPGPIVSSAIRVSPADAHNVFLQVEFSEQQTGPILTCPVPVASIARPGIARPGTAPALFSPLSNMGGCPALYASTDGGAHWTLAHLPMLGQLFYLNNSWPLTGIDAIQAQGDRLYADMTPASYATGASGFVNGGGQGAALVAPLAPGGNGGIRLVTSTDHGATWQFADTALTSQAPAVCSAYVAPQGTTLYALAAAADCWAPTPTSRALWRSDDGGGHWSQVGSFQDSISQFVAVGGGSSTTSQLYVVATDQADVSTLRQSADGGHTWQVAPVAGLPGKSDLYQIAGVLSDGSVVAAMLPTLSTTGVAQPTTAFTFTFYALKARGVSWRQLSSPSPTIGQPGYMLVARGSASNADGIWIVSGNGAFLTPGATCSTYAYLLD